MKLLRDIQAYHHYAMGIAHYRGLFRPVDHVEAASCFMRSASLGLPAAQNRLGLMCLEGDGVPRHYREAFRWFRESAESNDPEGNCLLGQMYAQGTGTQQSWKDAERHWLAAAAAGNGEALYFIGLLHYAGIEREPSSVEAAIWFEKSAVAGHAPAAHALGCMHRSGEHPASNQTDAIKWFQLAIEHDYGPSLAALASIYEAPGERHDADAATNLYKKAALAGDRDAMYRVGMMYLDREGGKESPFDSFLALGWLKKAVEEDHAGAAYVLGCLYEGGEGVFFEPDGKNMAIDCFRKSAKLGDKRAEVKMKWVDKPAVKDSEQIDLASKLVPLPPSGRAPVLNWMERSREKRELEQLFESANKFYISEEGKKEPERAVEYFRLCSAAGSAEADFMLGYMYETGEGVALDHEQAKHWYRSAVERGNAEALDHLRKLSS